jgi:type VI secretion system protein ImpI
VLRIKIKNFDKLPNGGPLEYTVDRRGFDFGRDQHLDWTLPDKSRVVSGKHCEVRFYDDAYWLFDMSTNGTFINNSSKRMQSPYRLNDGDKLSVGDYVLSVSITMPKTHESVQVAAADLDSPSPLHSSDSIWDSPVAAPPPIDPRDLVPAPAKSSRSADFLHHAAYVPKVFEPDPIRKPQPAAAAPLTPSDPWSAKSAVAVRQNPDDLPFAAASMPEKASMPGHSDLPHPNHPASQRPIDVAVARDFIRRFARGAGIPEETLASLPPGDVAEEAGRLLMEICGQLMALLHVRAEAKALSRSGNRTLIQQSENNPLKFMPTAQEALRVMLGPRTTGYLDAHQTVDSTFADLKHHQIASLAAMQAAITQLLDEISPEAITKATEGKKSLLAGGKGKQWDTYVERWNARAGRREHGMLGAFLELYAEHYDRLSKFRT